jgi:hypothetical protein
VVSVAPAVLAEVSSRLNVGAATKLDDREKNSTVCIRFLHLRGQKQIQVKNDTVELQKGCFHLALEIQKIFWPEARKLENSDLEIALFTSTGGRMEGPIFLRSRGSTSQEMEEDALVGILMSFMLGNSVPRGPGGDAGWQFRLKAIKDAQVLRRSADRARPWHAGKAGPRHFPPPFFLKIGHPLHIPPFSSKAALKIGLSVMSE